MILLLAFCVLLLVAMLTLVQGAGLLGRRHLSRRLARESRGQLYLTYDDGPSDRLTPALLDLLASHGAVATFFVKGGAAESRPDLLKRIVSEGHCLGSHSYRHVDAWKRPLAGLMDVIRGHRVVRAVCPAESLRPPYGRPTSLTFIYCWLKRIRLIMWTVDAKDASSDIRRIEDVVADVERGQGAVVLMHDLDLPLKEAGDRHAHVLSLTAALLEHANARDLRVSRFD